MSLSVEEFWRLAASSGLVTAEQHRRLQEEFASLKGAARGNADVLAAWLVDRNAITAYHSRVLLAGRAGPFHYGPYLVLQRENQGWLAGMFRAVHLPTNHHVLLQFLAGDYLRDDQLWVQVAQRTVSWSRMVNRHLVRYYHAQDLRRFRFLVLENLEGQTLAERLHQGPLPEMQAAQICRLAALGLGVLHQCGVVYGSLNPKSVWLSNDGNVKLIPDPTQDPDHPLAERPRGAAPAPDLADYCAPELDEGQASELGDIYALGCILYEALAGYPPFAGGNRSQKRQRHAQEPLRPLREVSEGLQQVAAQLTAKRPELRAGDAAAASELLRHWIPAQLQAYRPPPPSASHLALERWLRENPPELLAPAETQAANPSATISGGPLTPLEPASQTAPALALSAPQRASSPQQPKDAALLAGGSRPAPTAPTKPRNPLVSPPAPPSNPSPPLILIGAGASEPVAREPLAARSRRPPLMRLAAQVAIAGAAALLVAGIGYLLSLDRQSSATKALRKRAVGPQANAPSTVQAGADDRGPGAGTAAGEPVDPSLGNWTLLAEDDGQSLWAPPTQGPALSLQMTPARMLALVAIRPAELQADAEGQRLLRALGPRFGERLQQWEAAAAMPLQQARHVVMTLHPNGERFPQPAFVVTLEQPLPRDRLLARWPAARQQSIDAAGAAVLQADPWAFYVPPGESVAAFAMGTLEQMQEVAERQGAPPPLRSVVEKLLQLTDSQRQINILATPHDLNSDFFRDGRTFYFGPASKLREPLEWILGDHLQGILFSVHLDQQHCYLELRLAPDLGLDRYQLATQMRERMQELPRLVQTYLAQTINPPVYWRQVAFQLPSMLRFVHRQTRIQADQSYAVLNASLPKAAAHNLAFAGEMLLVATPTTSPGVVAAPAAGAPTTLEALLQTKTTISFPQLALDFALAAIVDDIKETYPQLPFRFDIKLLGGDLQLNGITQNQQIRDFQQEDQTVAAILTAMVVKANPDPSSTGASDPRQALVWIVGPDPDNPGEPIVLITTRDAAAKNNYTLPEAFRQP